MPLTLNVDGLPAGSNASSISVMVGKLPCPLIGTPTANQVVCTPLAVLQGQVYAEYWVLPVGLLSSSVPSQMLDSFGPPGKRTKPYNGALPTLPLLGVCYVS